jgi:flagellar motility protein MotE (MotC chaperone)
MNPRYTIEVSDESVEITGRLTIREAFDFLNFFEREGYTSLEWSENSTLFMVKVDLDQEKTERVNKETLQELYFAQEQNKAEKEKSLDLFHKVRELEGMVKNFFQDESDRVKDLRNQLEKQDKLITLLKLKNSPEAAEIMKIPGIEGEGFSGSY